MANDRKDQILEDAIAAERKLRRLLESRPTTLAQSSAAMLPTEAPELLEEGTLLDLVGPDGSVSWSLRFVDDVGPDTLLPENESPLPSSILDGMARAVPVVAQAIQSGKLFELIGPGPALAGLRDGSMEMLKAKSGGFLGGVALRGTTKIAHQARFATVSVAATMAPGLAVVVASAVLGHMHMVEIRRQLARLEGRLDRLLEGQQAARHGKLVGALEVLTAVTRAASSAGSVDGLHLHRLAAAEIEIRQVVGELEQLHHRYAASTAALRSATFDSAASAFGSTRAQELDDARLYILALTGLVQVQRLILGTANDEAARQSAEASLQAALAKLGAAEGVVLGHLRQFHENVRHVLDQELARSLRLTTGATARVSENLRLDRIEVAEIMSAAQRLLEGATAAPLHVVRVDPRRGQLRAQVALLEEGTT